MGLFGFGKKEKDKMKDGLEKTRTGFWGNILNTLTGSKIDDDLYDELEEQLILADVGGDVAIKLVDALRDRVQEKGLKTGEQAADALRGLIADEMRPEAEMALDGHPAVILVIGVNGVGKTTSIAKLADYYTRQGKKVMLAAGDTFRAAASEQLEIWAGRAGVPIVKAGEGADPAAVIFDTVKSATARGYDMVIADTAGRLHNKSNLMNELSKISRSVKKAAPEASLETLLVLDAITGQNAISQAKEFCKAADATGIILTKLDGTAKGGCVVAATGSSCGITYLMGGDYGQVAAAVKNMIANLTGMICDGAKPSCALKLTSGVSTAVLSAMLAMQQKCVSSVEGIIDDDVDKSIHNLTSIGAEAMNETDRKVLEIMTHKS